MIVNFARDRSVRRVESVVEFDGKIKRIDSIDLEAEFHLV